ncbi:MAG: Nif3-like dinuclear metal center hexameric protein [Treponema sp.]|jgi:putative NIF3 family GTP cyclohydrolase 1 type 2|nr:Nif3-like dinuclear metal center hexameric protein [Treponema sp.]
MTVQEIIDRIIRNAALPHPLERSCDRLMTGDPGMSVTRIVTTFMATVEVIRQARSLGANLIITHEPTWFTGKDDTAWLEGNPVYEAKRTLIAGSGVAIWRYHDHMHMKKPDSIYTGILNELGWGLYGRKPIVTSKAPPPDIPGSFTEGFQDYYDIPAITLRELSAFFKKKLDMKRVRIIGNPAMVCSRVGILVGGGSLGLGSESMPMEVMAAHDIHVMVCGDITEWTLPAYVNDAAMLGYQRALLIIGHERSEEWGMKYMTQWLPDLIGGIPVSFVNAKEPFKYL